MMSDNNDVGAIAASGTGALAVPVEPASGLAPTGFDHLSQRARDIAADTVFRINSASATHDPENTAAYCQYMREAAYDDSVVVQAALTAPEEARAVTTNAVLDRYDAGLLNDFGGGDVDWWQDYIRAELERAHEFYQSQVYALAEGR